MEEFNRAGSMQLFAHLGKALIYMPETEMVYISSMTENSHTFWLLNLEFLAAHLPSKLALLGVTTLVR